MITEYAIYNMPLWHEDYLGKMTDTGEALKAEKLFFCKVILH